MSIKNTVFVNFLFHHLCQYDRWVCCSNKKGLTKLVPRASNFRRHTEAIVPPAAAEATS